MRHDTRHHGGHGGHGGWMRCCRFEPPVPRVLRGGEFEALIAFSSVQTHWRLSVTFIAGKHIPRRTVLRGLGEALTQPEIGGDHFRSSAVFLTQTHPRQTESSDVRAGISLDQLYAKKFGQDTPIPSMQLCIENVDQAGGCAYGYSCVYTDMISWASPTEPLPMIRDPRMAFDQLFGAGGSAQERPSRRRSTTSVLDYITRQVADLSRRLDASDKQRMERYLEDVRESERRIQQVEVRNASGESRELPGAPAGVPDSFDEHVKLMFDL